MLDQYFEPTALARLQSSPFGPWLEAYVARLDERGNCYASIRRYVHAVEHFGCWLQRRHLAPQDITHKTVQKFLQSHLPHCRCAPPVTKQHDNVRTALLHLLRQPPFADNSTNSPTSPADELLVEYDHFLHEVAGLAEATRRYRRQYVRSFLKEIPGWGAGDWARLQPQDVVAFFNRFARHLQPGSIQVAASSLRSFLRFLRTTGRCDRDLTGAIPSVPHWSMSSLPRFLTPIQVRIFLRQFDRRTAKGRRNYAMALCLVELGLRASEVAGLCLTDIDWRAGTLRIASSKNPRDRELPLPQNIGRAIADYLRRSRPTTTSRHLFVRLRNRNHQAISTILVRSVMRRALVKVPGFEQFGGCHVLRHTTATRLFQRGVPLKIVADLLGHQSIDTTQIYTKVDVPTLTNVALPWPEVQP